jgi:hypothetical protein
VLTNTLNHLMTNVLPAARDYAQAENELSRAFGRNNDPNAWEGEGQHAKRRAAEIAIAIDGLADRAASALGLTPEQVRQQVASGCIIDGASAMAVSSACARSPMPISTLGP